jgi:2,3-dihydroxybenzoate decarboxylase
MKRRTVLSGLVGAGVAAGLASTGDAASTGAPKTTGRLPGHRIVAVEEACQIPEIHAALKRRAGNSPPSMKTGPIAGPFVAPLLDLGTGRVAQMDADGVDVQILSITSPGVQLFDAAEAVTLAALANDRMADAVKAFPTRFGALATMAPQDPAATAREIERAITTLGMNGALVNSHTNGEYLDDPKFWPIFEAAEALDCPIYIHPRDPSPGMEGPLTIPGFTVGWGYAVETGTHALRLISAGVFDRFPKLTVVLGHMGECLPFLADRINNRFVFEGPIARRQVKLRQPPADYLKTNFYVTTSGMNFWAPLAATLAVLGRDRVIYAIDHPMEVQAEEVQKLLRFPMKLEDRRFLCETNAVRVFKLKA